ncbi:PEP-CTERM sorting domain-containing protein [Erythrobacter litoralis]|uniref:PEPxxWA-CTERM sorting domain-containing protein n=1 Tax=Erythrobacter litoralis TaxID=39960 RepID=UPI002434E6DC|nr:PEPxxWA-CTERM sorting domain-containing protein [Erythrobacter litoralis]MDG6079375.1 PEP-CTERM sorting domain-containing protein [Erythrobacter litoralis]
MKIRHITVGLAALAAASLPGAASAATLLFDFEGGDRSFSFTLDDTQAPDRTDTFLGTRIFYNNVSGSFVGVNGSSDLASTISFGTGPFAPISFTAQGFGFSNFGGPDLFNGSATNPMFNLGTFNLSQVNTGPGTGGGVLTISQAPMGGAVPEPAAWALMILGFGLTGLAMRNRNREVSVRFAA